MSRVEVLKQKEDIDESQIINDLADGFINSIPENGPLHEKSEKGETTTRAIAFGQLYNQLLTISMGSENLSRQQKESIMKRIGALKTEAFHWTRQSKSGRDFAQEIDEIAKSIWRR